MRHLLATCTVAALLSVLATSANAASVNDTWGISTPNEAYVGGDPNSNTYDGREIIGDYDVFAIHGAKTLGEPVMPCRWSSTPTMPDSRGPLAPLVPSTARFSSVPMPLRFNLGQMIPIPSLRTPIGSSTLSAWTTQQGQETPVAPVLFTALPGMVRMWTSHQSIVAYSALTRLGNRTAMLQRPVSRDPGPLKMVTMHLARTPHCGKYSKQQPGSDRTCSGYWLYFIRHR